MPQLGHVYFPDLYLGSSVNKVRKILDFYFKLKLFRHTIISLWMSQHFSSRKLNFSVNMKSTEN